MRLQAVRHFGLTSLYCALVYFPLSAAAAPQVDQAAIVRKVDAAVKARVDAIASYTVTEHYAVFRNHDEVHPAGEMTVKTLYRKQSGKSYTIVAQSGSQVIRKMVLGTILDHEKQVNEPGVREGAWFVSANYNMKLKPGGTQQMNGHDCVALTLTPKRKAPFLIQGTLWVDATDGSIVQVEGTASESGSIFTGPAHMMRQYAKVSGFAEATYARAVSDSFMFGQTVVTIDYNNYSIQLAQ